MKKSMLLLVLGSVVVTLGLAGCAGMGGGPKPEELVMQQTTALADDFVACNADKLLGYISEDFVNEHVSGKAEIKEHIDEAKDKGKIEEYKQMIKDHDGKIDLTQAKVTVKDDTATVYPITASADVGSVTIELNFKKDPDKVWRVVGINIEGI